VSVKGTFAVAKQREARETLNIPSAACALAKLCLKDCLHPVAGEVLVPGMDGAGGLPTVKRRGV
jgi:hypothetical protein